jgi:hypothetical protein
MQRRARRCPPHLQLEIQRRNFTHLDLPRLIIQAQVGSTLPTKARNEVQDSPYCLNSWSQGWEAFMAII